MDIIANRMRPILASVRTAARPGSSAGQPVRVGPFITISRQGGAGGVSVAEKLVSRLNVLQPGDPPWSSWDKELVEKVANDNQIAAELVENLEDASRSWLSDFLTGFSANDHAYPAEAAVFRRVAKTVRALAQIGRVVLVGRGSVFLTRNMLGGVHIRLVAPFPRRVSHMAQRLSIPWEAACKEVREIDHNREIFHRRYFASESLGPETFHLTLNTALIAEDAMLDAIIPLVQDAARQVQLAAQHEESGRLHLANAVGNRSLLGDELPGFKL